MKRIINTLIAAAMVMLAFSCQTKEGLGLPMNESIVLDISSGLTKADDTSTESYVNHIDVFIYTVDDNAPADKFYYARYQVNNAPVLALNAKRSDFGEKEKYYVYLVANSSISESVFEAMETFNELVDIKQEDPNLHLSGITANVGVEVPLYFLMDAVATDSEGGSPVVLNNGVLSDNTVLKATLRRAAAKVFINITAGDNVEFKAFSSLESDGGRYYVRNLPYDAFLLAEAKAADEIQAKVRTAQGGNNTYFYWNPAENSKKVTLVTYVYPNHWENTSILEHETCVVMNIPMTYKNGETSVDHKNSWYKIPMTDDATFERNNYYEVNITLNRPGASSDTSPETIDYVQYNIVDWTNVEVNVGGETRPDYLQLNVSHVDIYNENTDSGTLKFASSSPIPANGITLLEAYYFNYLDKKVDLSVSANDKYEIYDSIVASADQNVLNGGITITSPFVDGDKEFHANATRHLRFRVTNATGQTAEFTVAQYPTLYITNELGYYSYREDFGGTTYLQNGNPSRSGVSWSSNRWEYSSSSSSNVFFGSKVRGNQNSNGTYQISYTYWNGTTRTTTSQSTFNNPRMYHVHVTATSSDYVVAKPRLDAEGYTESSADNARLVSPSFMIASQLGGVNTSYGQTALPGGIEQAKKHCEQYVEAVSADQVYSDWRLPTAAEIQIIIAHQDISDAMDEVLSGTRYYCAYNTDANGNVIYTYETGKPASRSSHVRCVRDAY